MAYIGEIAALLTAFCWSLSSIIFTAAGKRLGALQVNLYRLPLAVFLLGVTYWGIGGTLQVPVEAMLYLAVSGIIGLAIGDSFLFEAFVRIGSRLSMLLLSLSPPMTALLAFIFLGERLKPLAIVGIGITVLGVSWVVAERTPTSVRQNRRISVTGVLFAILAALGQSVGILFARKGMVTTMPPLLATLIRMASAGIVLWPLSLLTGWVQSPRVLFRQHPPALKLMLIGVFFGPYLGVTLSMLSVKYTDAGIAATLMSTVPVMMLPMVMALEKERPSLHAVLGAVIAVVGIGLLFVR